MNPFDRNDVEISWCPGCGNFQILKALKDALSELNIEPENIVLVSGIGQAAKLPQYFKSNYFNGLHGRAIPVATAIKAANPNLTVIVVSGDGCVYGEGGNHFIHAMRRNPDITLIVCNNMIYGLTKGQASPSSQLGFVTKAQPHGVTSEPFNPISTAVNFDASFVARAFCQQIEQTKNLYKKAILNKGFSLVDTFQPCISFNEINTYGWFKEKTYYLENHDTTNRIKAFERSLEEEKLPLGIFYTNNKRPTFEENAANANKCQQPLLLRGYNRKEKLLKLVQSFK